MKTQDLQSLTDQQLIQLYIKGNTESFSVLIERHKAKIFTAIYLLVRDKYVAEDIFQDLFLKVIDNIKKEKYSDEGKFLPWVMRIAHNMSMDHFRRIKRMPTITTNYGEDIFDVMNFQSPAVDNEIMSNQTANSVKQMVDNLPDDLREVVILRHYADLSFKEIAQLTNCSINTALGRMRYALQNLKKQAELKHVTF